LIWAVIKGERTLAFSPPPRLPWPLELGKVETGTGVMPGIYGGPVSFALKVEAYEDVRVPAGTFKAFRVYIDAVARVGLGHFALTTWYAPELRQFVKTESRADGNYVPDVGYRDLQDFELVALDRPIQMPLHIALESPPDQAHVTDDTLAVTGKATSGRGIAQVIVTLNAVEVARIEPRDGPSPIVRVDPPSRSVRAERPPGHGDR
jgi:hypothetical protein